MSGLETAIRSALERSDRTNAELRARIYQSARQALEAGLRKQNITEPAVIDEQRHRLESVIHDIERQERERLEIVDPSIDEIAAPALEGLRDRGAAPDVGGVERPGQQARAPAPADDGSFGSLRAERDDRGPAIDRRGEDTHSAAPLDVRPEGAVRPRKRRSGVLARMFIFCTLAIAAGTGAWWVVTSGVLLSEAQRDTSVPNPPPRAEAEDFTGEPVAAGDAQQGFSEDWIDVYNPTMTQALTPGAGTTASPIGEGDDQAVRILSSNTDANGGISISVPVEALREMAGKTSTVALTLKADGDQPVQIGVTCNFGRLGDCARHRFTVNPERGDVLFQVSFEMGMAPGNPGSLVLNADLSGSGRGVDLYAVRVLPGR